MGNEEKKTSTITFLLIIGIAIVFVLMIFAIFSSYPQTQYSTSPGGLDVRFNGNTTLKSNTFFDLNFTVFNPYEISIENVKIWVESGRLFTTASALLSNTTTIRIFTLILPKSSATYYFGNVKVERIESEMKDVPIIIKILYDLKFSKNFTINVVNNNSLKLYGGVENMGIKQDKKEIKSPISISFTYNPRDFIFEEGRKTYAAFKIMIENVGGGYCTDEIRVKLQSNQNIICEYNKTQITINSEISIKPAKKVEIPCNYTLSYLKEKDFDSINSRISIYCKYLESKTFYFKILP